MTADLSVGWINDWGYPEGFTKDGPGVMVLGGAWVDGSNAIAGTGGDSLPINGGTLVITGTFGGSGGWNQFGVAGGATLAGNGTINTTPTVVHAGGTLAPGWAGVGTMTFAGDSPVTLEDGSNLSYSLATGNSAIDSFLNLQGNLTINSNITLSVVSWAGPGTYNLATCFGTITDNSGPGDSGPGFSGWTATGVNGLAVPNFILSGGTTLQVQFYFLGLNETWSGNSDQSWSTGGNWNFDYSPPTNAGDTATFPDILGVGTTSTITMDGSHTVSFMSFDTTSGGSYVITGADTDTLTLDNSTGQAVVLVNGGSQTIAAPVMLASDLNFVGGPGASLTISGPLGESVPGRALMVNGAGTLVLNGAASYSGPTTVNGGTLEIGGLGAVTNTSGLAGNPGCVFQIDPGGSFTIPSGTINFPGTMFVGGALAVTNSTAMISVGNFLMTGPGTFTLHDSQVMNVSSPGGDWSVGDGYTVQLAAGGTFTMTGGSLDVDSSGPAEMVDRRCLHRRKRQWPRRLQHVGRQRPRSASRP